MDPINIYVRRGEDRYSRTVRFNLPEFPPNNQVATNDPIEPDAPGFTRLGEGVIPQTELLDLGFAIDGNQVVCTITRLVNEEKTLELPGEWFYAWLEIGPSLGPNVEPGSYEGRWRRASSLADALLGTQRGLAAYLKARSNREVQYR